MNKVSGHRRLSIYFLTLCCFIGIFSAVESNAQSFDFDRLQQQVRSYTVVLKIKVELSFGMQNTEQEIRLLGTIVTEDGMVVFDGSAVSSENSTGSIGGMTFKATPTQVEVMTLDKKTYKAEFVGVDRFTKFGFARVTDPAKPVFVPVKFAVNPLFRLGSWVGGYTLLPEFVNPPIAADIGMISALIESPEKFPLTVGFNPMQIGSVLYDERLTPVGILGTLMDPSAATSDVNGMIEGSGYSDYPMLGIVTGDRIQKLIANPPKKGEDERSWLGITLQALTKDLSEFMNISAKGGIIVNEIVKGSPADKSGLQVGDVIYEINGLPVDVDMEEKIPVFQRKVAEMAPGTKVEFSVIRQGSQKLDTLKISTVLEAAPTTPTNAPVYENKELEFKVRNLVFSDYISHNLEVGALTGVVVSDLKSGGLADVGGLELGDVVQRIGSSAVTSIDDAKQIMTKLVTEKPREVIFFVWRNNKTMFVNVKTDWQ